MHREGGAPVGTFAEEGGGLQPPKPYPSLRPCAVAACALYLLTIPHENKPILNKRPSPLCFEVLGIDSIIRPSRMKSSLK